jgi:hypothetical protein
MAVEKNKVYPSRTRRMKIQGSVQVEIAIDAAGNITAARMVRSPARRHWMRPRSIRRVKPAHPARRRQVLAASSSCRSIFS